MILHSFLVRSYFTIITVGGLNFRVDLDTGSADLWLASSACQTNTCKNVPLYPLNHQSSSFAELNGNKTAFKAQYADTTCAWNDESQFDCALLLLIFSAWLLPVVLTLTSQSRQDSSLEKR